MAAQPRPHRRARSAPEPFGRSVGEFLCLHPQGPPVENIDDLPWLDIKQDAALRALTILRALGKPISDDAVATFNAEPAIARLAYHRAYADAVRERNRRSRKELPVTTLRRLARALATAIVDLARYDVSRHGLALFPDPAQQEELEALAADYAGEVARLRDEGIPGLTLDESCLVISQMQEAQRLKDAGARRLPSHLRQRIRRLRDRTGLPLRTDLL